LEEAIPNRPAALQFAPGLAERLDLGPAVTAYDRYQIGKAKIQHQRNEPAGR
jgi:hypothetical protein